MVRDNQKYLAELTSNSNNSVSLADSDSIALTSRFGLSTTAEQAQRTRKRIHSSKNGSTLKKTRSISAYSSASSVVAKKINRSKDSENDDDTSEGSDIQDDSVFDTAVRRSSRSFTLQVKNYSLPDDNIHDDQGKSNIFHDDDCNVNEKDIDEGEETVIKKRRKSVASQRPQYPRSILSIEANDCEINSDNHTWEASSSGRDSLLKSVGSQPTVSRLHRRSTVNEIIVDSDDGSASVSEIRRVKKLKGPVKPPDQKSQVNNRRRQRVDDDDDDYVE